VPRGIVTRNSHHNALETLRAAGLADFFAEEGIVGRAAGVTTLYVDPDGDFPFAEHADHVFADLVELRERLRP
jgi:phosphoglycolate phosphatase-like HAD superfamily hydrolase